MKRSGIDAGCSVMLEPSSILPCDSMRCSAALYLYTKGVPLLQRGGVNKSHISYASDYSFKVTDALEFLHWILEASQAGRLFYAWWSVPKATTIFMESQEHSEPSMLR